MRKLVRRGIAVALSFAVAVSGIAVQKYQPEEVKAADTNYQLVWSDEFNGSSLDRNVWNVEQNGDGGGNGELQYYLDDADNIKVSDGSLKITALKESYGGKNYTSGRITTQNNKYFQYGRFEARMKLPSFSGAWPAFWTLGQTHAQLGWPNCSEIDIMEAINDENGVYGTAHWGYNGNNTEAGLKYEVNRTEWHVYAMEWDENEIRWYCDDVNYFTLPISDAGQMDELRGAQFIIFNLAIGGSWPGYNIDDSAFPNSSTMEVDYVRVYQDPDCPYAKFEEATRDGKWHEYGNWEVMVATDRGNSTAQVAVDPLDYDHIKLQQLSSTWDDAWLVQARYTKSGLQPGEKYKISVDLTSYSTDGQYATDARDDEAVVTLPYGTRTVTRTAVADANGEVYITFGIGWVGTTAVLDFSNVNCRVYDPNEIEKVTDDMEFISAIRDDLFHPYGNWELYVASSWADSQARIAVDPTDANHIQVWQSQSNWQDGWSVQARYTAKGLKPGQTYTLSVRMMVSAADGSYVSDAVEGQNNVGIAHINGERYITKTATADANGELYLTLGFGWTGLYTKVDLDNVSCVEGTVGASAKSWNYEQAIRDDATHKYGNWGLYIGASWANSTANIAVNPNNADNISIMPLTTDWSSQWSIQAQYVKSGLTPGQKYKFTTEMTASSGDSLYVTDADGIARPLQVGTKTLSKIAEADENGNITFTVGLGTVTPNTSIEFDNVSCVEYVEESVDEPVVARTNIALGKTATSSANESDERAAAYAFDGDEGTRWASGRTDDEWITVDLGRLHSVDEVKLNWEAAYAKEYEIQVSVDGTNWTTVKSLTEQDGGIDTISFDAVNAKYVRMQGVSRGTQYGYSLYEMEVYGTEIPVPTSDKLKIEGYQISYTLQGLRVVSSIEPAIDGKKVVRTGNIYGLPSEGVEDADLILNSEHEFVKNFDATSAGLLDKKMGASATANYYAMTMIGNGTTAAAYQREYIVRAYAVLEDNTIVYSPAKTYSIYYVAKLLYDGALMNNYAGHSYLFNDILKVVDVNYKEVEYNWDNAFAK